MRPRRSHWTGRLAGLGPGLVAWVFGSVWVAATAGAAPVPPPVVLGEARAVTPQVRLGALRLEGGEVPKLAASLDRALGGIGACVVEHGGLAGSEGLIEARFLVRAGGRAEGVETSKLRGVSEQVGRCVRKLLKDHRVGAPSHEPVGVTAPFLLSVPASARAPEPPPADGAPAAPKEPPNAKPKDRDGDGSGSGPPTRERRIRSSKHRTRDAGETDSGGDSRPDSAGSEPRRRTDQPPK